MKVVWSVEARLDLDDIFDYIVEDNPVAASEVYKFIYTYAKQLGANPEFGHEGRVEGTRELIVPRYRRRYTIVYKIADANIEIISVWHASRQWPASFDRSR